MMLQIKALIADGILEGVKSIAPQSEMTAEDEEVFSFYFV